MNDAPWIEQIDDGALSVTVPERFSDSEFEREFDEFSRRLHAADRPLSLLIIVKMKTRSRPANRERAKRFFQEDKEMLKERVRAGAVVSENVAIRGAIRGVSLLGLFPFTVKTFSDVSSARTWLASVASDSTSDCRDDRSR